MMALFFVRVQTHSLLLISVFWYPLQDVAKRQIGLCTEYADCDVLSCWGPVFKCLKSRMGEDNNISGCVVVFVFNANDSKLLI